MTEKAVSDIAQVLKDASYKSPPEYKRHHDDEFCDEIRIKVIPRFKTSGMSGDEWRVSTRIQLFRKGMCYAETSYSRMKDVLMLLGHFYITSHEPVPTEAIRHEEKKCDQPGCDQDAVNHYRKKVEHHGNSGHTSEPKYHEVWCKFCARHSERGDSDLEDNDQNLTLMKGNGIVRAYAEDESPSMFGGVIEVGDADGTGDAQ
jgi:hypothetical protein